MNLNEFINSSATMISLRDVSPLMSFDETRAFIYE